MKLLERVYQLPERKRKIIAIFITFLFSIPLILFYLRGIKESFSTLKMNDILSPFEKIEKEFKKVELKKEVEKIIQKQLNTLLLLEGEIKNEEKGN